MRPQILAIAAFLLLIGAAPASAQRADLGATVSDFYVGYGNGNFVGAGPFVTIHFTGKHALQVVTDLRYQHWMNSKRFTGIYSVQYRRTFQKAGSPTKIFLTAGTVGGLGWSRVSIVGFETRNRFMLTPPWVPVAGAGVERNITPRVALRADATGAFGPYGAVGVRVAAGIVLSIGRPMTGR